MHQQMPNPGQTSQLPQRMRTGQPGMSGSPPQGNMLQPGVAGYQVQQNMWQGGFDPPMQDPQGHSPSDTLSNTSAQAVPMTMNVEDWLVVSSNSILCSALTGLRFQFFGINGDLSGMNGDVPLA
jgi:hypothetical protein